VGGGPSPTGRGLRHASQLSLYRNTNPQVCLGGGLWVLTHSSQTLLLIPAVPLPRPTPQQQLSPLRRGGERSCRHLGAHLKTHPVTPVAVPTGPHFLLGDRTASCYARAAASLAPSPGPPPR